MSVQFFAVGISPRIIYGSIRISVTQRFKCLPSSIVIVQIAIDGLVDVQIAERLVQIIDRIKHQRIVSSCQSERIG